jgi:hypothetical protein
MRVVDIPHCKVPDPNPKPFSETFSPNRISINAGTLELQFAVSTECSKARTPNVAFVTLIDARLSIRRRIAVQLVNFSPIQIVAPKTIS